MGMRRKILVLGASGLIGRFLADDLRAQGFEVVGVARTFAPSQRNSPLDLELPVMSMDVTGWRICCATAPSTSSSIAWACCRTVLAATPPPPISGPLGALVKTGPAIVLMLVALLTLDDR